MDSKPLEIRRILSRNLKEQRKQQGYSQERFAEISGLSVQTINDIEGGRKWVSDKTITKLSDALHVECYQLLIPDFSSQNKNISQNMKGTISTQRMLELMKKLKKSVDSQIDDHFTDFLKSSIRK